MRSWLPWLLMFGVIAGLCGRVLALDHVHPEDQAEHCCGHNHGSTDEHHHDPDCPPGPHDHHNHACCHPAPLAGGEIEHHRVPVRSHSWLGVIRWATSPPESPVFELDKPPLI